MTTYKTDLKKAINQYCKGEITEDELDDIIMDFGQTNRNMTRGF